MKQEFPLEERIYGSNAEQVTALIRRVYRWDVRIVLALLKAFGRSPFDFWVVDENERLVGTTLVTYGARAGFLSTVSVHPDFRRRGFAQALLARSHEGIRRSRRPYAILEVIRDNVPARALYARAGYRPLRSNTVLTREPDPGDRDRPRPKVPGLRALRREDAPALVTVANATQSPELREWMPFTREQFFLPPLLASSVDAVSRAWVLEEGGRAVAFLRATVGGLTHTAHLTQPIFAPEVSALSARALVDTALAWVATERPARSVVELPEDRPAARAVLEEAGFQPVLQLDTLGLDLGT